MAKLQWNKMNAEVRESLGEFAVAVWELADKKAQYTKTKNARKICLDTDLADLEKLEKGDTKSVLRDKATIEKSIATLEKTIEDAKEAEKKIEDEIKKRMQNAYDLIPTKLFEAYENRVEDSEAYGKAIADFLTSINVTPTASGIAVLRDTVGEKEVNGKAVVKNAESVGLTNHKKDAFCRMFLKGMCRDMIKANCLKLDRYKFEFVIEEKNK